VYGELAPYRERIEILPEDPADWRMTEEEKRAKLRSRIRALPKLAGKHIFTRKHLVVQSGCDNFCTFCLTVQARGRHRWRPMEEILEDIDTFVADGGQEIVLTGINLGAWGAPSSNDFRASRLAELTETILEKTRIARIRLSSIGVEFFDERLVNLFRESRVNAYAHLSIQSGSNTVLKRMNRHYNAEKVHEVSAALRALRRTDDVLLNI
jgi:tRNA A37 methylthiotransferase MiaB